MTEPTEAVQRVLAYHERTKHHPQRYARSLGYLDWESQPDPFRTFEGAPRVQLPLAADGVTSRYCDLYEAGAVSPLPLALESVAAFFELALGLTAWKEMGEARWALRADPSSGNLHPTEGYAVLPELAGVPAGVHHYVSRDHVLEQRCAFAPGLPAETFLVGLASIHWRESWKYGERAYRYCQHDAGHVLGTVRYAAAALGWSAHLLDGCGDASVARVLGLDRDVDYRHVDELDAEHPDALLLVGPGVSTEVAAEVERSATDLAERAAVGVWAGLPNELSPSHEEWEAVHVVAEAGRRPAQPVARWMPDELPEAPNSTCTAPAATVIRQRRSAVALDRSTSISRERLYETLDRLLPRPGQPPWDVLPWSPKVHLGLFVNRVDDLAPGLYLLERADDVHERLRIQLGPKALWQRAPGCPEHLRLYCLREANVQRAAAAISCSQEIAADGAFSLGMIADFHATIDAGAFWYRRLFWETGVLGQVLYLEAEAAGVRGTGIGCYFDDAFHDVLGLEGDSFQSLYHFTVGGPVDDERLVTHPPYAHLDRAPSA